MGSSILGFAFGGLLGGFLLTSRVLAWLVGLHVALRRQPDAATSRSFRPWPIALLLHSGPWLLALAVGIAHHVATTQPPEFLWALLGGLGTAFVFILAVTSRASKPRVRPPLTPERFAQKRREFFLFNVALFTLLPSTALAVMDWGTLDRDYPEVILMAIGGPLGGWLYSLVMWQWYGTALQVAEKKRRQRAERESRAASAAG